MPSIGTSRCCPCLPPGREHIPYCGGQGLRPSTRRPVPQPAARRARRIRTRVVANWVGRWLRREPGARPGEKLRRRHLSRGADLPPLARRKRLSRAHAALGRLPPRRGRHTGLADDTLATFTELARQYGATFVDFCDYYESDDPFWDETHLGAQGGYEMGAKLIDACFARTTAGTP